MHIQYVGREVDLFIRELVYFLMVYSSNFNIVWVYLNMSLFNMKHVVIN